MNTGLRESIEDKLLKYYGVSSDEAHLEQVYRSIVLTVKEQLLENKAKFRKEYKKQKTKRIYYLCMEFLVGKMLKYTLMNLNIEEEISTIISDWGYNIKDIYELDPDLGLGNGGLGRLAACYMDSLTSLNYYVTGFSICYEYGLFKQKIIDCNQIELPDDWLNLGENWLYPRHDKTFNVKFGGSIEENWDNNKCNIKYHGSRKVKAIPYDLLIQGYNTTTVNTIRLWKAVDTSKYDNLENMNQREYINRLKRGAEDEAISKVLYPEDNYAEGKILRLKQQYFFVSASVQNIISDYIAENGNLEGLSENVIIHINDTHPTLCIPEIIRILIDEHNYCWDEAWATVKSIVTYTNHTVLPEALEKWDENIIKMVIPRIYSIIKEINKRYRDELSCLFQGDRNKISEMSIINNSEINMASLSVIASLKVNGVSALHGEILKKKVFKDYSHLYPEKFTSVTNGISHRRWLTFANPKLDGLIEGLIGNEYKTNPLCLNKLRDYEHDKTILKKLNDIKQANKYNYSADLFKSKGIVVNPESVFDVQVKRIHEYKRQLLNILKILYLIGEIKNNNYNYPPITFFFGGKAASSYNRAKDIIKLICNISNTINNDNQLKEFINVVFIEEYNVSEAEKIIPSADISEQISLAGKEASGTGCMKFMMNGALTLGTRDGAVIEIADAVGNDNIYLFGHTNTEVDDIWNHGYNSSVYYMQSIKLQSAINVLSEITNEDIGIKTINYLLHSNGISDPFMCFADFESYIFAFEKAISEYGTQDYLNKSLINIAESGRFSADISINEYNKKIWKTKPIMI